MRHDRQKTASVLAGLLFLFVLRVVGQLIVFLYSPAFLPPMQAWYSGLMPYPYLLPAQVILISLMLKIIWSVQTQTGFWGSANQMLARWVVPFGWFYMLAMVARYVIRMTLLPDERWLGGCIPIVFHWVLATFVLVFGSHHKRLTRSDTSSFIDRCQTRI